MAKNLEVKLNLAGLNEIMKSAPLQQQVREAAEAVQKAAGDDYEVDVHLGDYDTLGYVSSKPGAKLGDPNELLKALGKVGLPLHK